MNDRPPPPRDDDNPEWTAEDFARARPAHELLPADAVAALVRKGTGSAKPKAARRR
jgi:hypothetical protein